MMNLGKIIGIRAMRSKSVGFPCLETLSIYKSQILRNIKTYMIMNKGIYTKENVGNGVLSLPPTRVL